MTLTVDLGMLEFSGRYTILEHQVDFEVFDSKYVKTKVEIPHKREQTTKLQQVIPIAMA